MSNKILDLHSNPYDIDFSKVTLPAGITRNDVIQRYKSAVDDLEYLERHYKRYIGDKQAPLQLMTDDLYGAIQTGVCYNEQDQIELKQLSKLVPKDSQKLYREVVNLVYGIADGKPKTDLTLRKFKSLLCYYLCVAGF